MTSANQVAAKQMRDGRSASIQDMLVAAELPWGAQKLIAPPVIDIGAQPGQFAAQTLFVDFVMHSERKIQQVLQEKVDKSLTKSLQRGEDAAFDQIVTALSGLSEHCLPSILRALITWYDQQLMQIYAMMQQKSMKPEPTKTQPAKNTLSEREILIEKRGLAVDFIFCLVLIEVLKQLHLHPGYDEEINYIINISFKRFQYKTTMSPNSGNAIVISDLFAEVVGVLAASRFHMIRKRFMTDLSELRGKEQSAHTVQHIIALLMGIKFFRVKMHLMEEFEVSLAFLHELGVYFLEVKEKDIKHALAGLFTEILLPVAAVGLGENLGVILAHFRSVRTEVNVPALKNFVDLLYSHTLDLASKRKYILVAYPLLTCLLCISQKTFFLTNWHYFLTLCLSNLKNKDPKISRGALESLYRLLWVYVIRLKCESNTATHSRLQSICTSLFPRGGRTVIPRDNPLNIFVKIVHFIGQERLDFAFKEIIYDLLCVGRPIRAIYPERMNIGLRALLVIADSLQQQDGPPAMPRSIGVLPSGNTLRVKKTYLTRPLNNETARNIGLDLYYQPCRKAFDGILRALDMQVGRPLMLTVVQASNKEPDDLLGGERKGKLDLFQTCIAAVPRLLPEGMSQSDLIDLVARMTVHMNEELKQHACQTLHNLITECPDWRDDVIFGFLQFVGRDLQDGYPQLMDSALKLLHALLSTWKNSVLPQVNAQRPEQQATPANRNLPANRVQVSFLLKSDNAALVLHCVEGMALLVMCQGRTLPRRIAIFILKEIKLLLQYLCGEDHEPAMLDILDSACEYVLDKYIQHVSQQEKDSWKSSAHGGIIDFQWLSEKLASVETDQTLVNSNLGNEYLQWDAWACALSGFTEAQFIPDQCPTAAAYTWPLAYSRITACFSYVDPNNPQNDTRASLLRSSKSKASWSMCGETLSYSNYLSLWQKYLVLSCALAPPTTNVSATVRSTSPVNLSISENSECLRGTELRIGRLGNVSAGNLFKLFVPLLRCEMTDMRDIVVLGLASVNPASFSCLLDELSVLLREAGEKKQENVRRRKRRDLLRLQLVRLVECVAFRNTLPHANMVDSSGTLKPVLLEFVDSCRLFVESDIDRDAHTFHSLRLHFSKMIHLLIKQFPVEKRHNLLPMDRRQPLFFQLMAWCSRLCHTDKNNKQAKEELSVLEVYAVRALCSVICCGSMFDPQQSIADDGYLYRWLDPFLASNNAQVGDFVCSTLVCLLDFNADVSQLVDWVVDCAYTQPAYTANKCFTALATIFGNREYPCDVAAMFNLTLLYSGYPVQSMQQLAIELMQILEELNFGDGHRFSEVREHFEDKMGVHVDSDPPHSRFAKSQMFLSQKMAELHPDMTMPIFSEISSRLLSARPARRASMLSYLLPWLHNIELIDSHLEQGSRAVTLSLAAKMAESAAVARRVLKGEGWGSAHATEMVLNNLLFITVKFGDEHSILLEQLWAGLIAQWPANLRVIIRYLSVMTILAPDTLLTYTQRIIVYLARVSPERLVEELIDELQIMDTFKDPLGRAENPPYFRWIRKVENEEVAQVCVEEGDGVIHTRRATPCDETAAAAQAVNEIDQVLDEHVNPCDPHASMASLVTLKADILNARADRHPSANDEKGGFCQPFQLPMPAYGGYFCSLSQYLPTNDQPIVPIHRSNIGVILVSSLVLSDVEMEWMVHLPLLLHMAVLGLDNSRALIHDHCKRLIINLIVTQSSGAVPPSQVASVLLKNRIGTNVSLVSRQSVHEHSNGDRYFDSVSSTASTAIMGDDGVPVQPAMRKQPANSSFGGKSSTVLDMVTSMTDFLASKMGNPLWPYEDVNARCWRTASAQLINAFVTQLSQLFAQLMPAARVETRWAQTALHVALCCSNRHSAGRSFQILRALRVAPTCTMLSDMLARLVETVGETGDDMQGYVTEIMLTLDASVLNMEVVEHSLASLFRVNGEGGSDDEMPPANQQASSHKSPTHCRSTSYSVAMIKRLSPAFDRKDQRLSLNAAVDDMHFGHLPRSKSAQVLKSVPEGAEEHLAALSQLYWIAVTLLESDFEHEFLLALHLLDKLLDLPSFERQDCLDRLDRMVKQLGWGNFPGILALVLKGCIFASSFEFMVHVLIKLLQVVDAPAVAADYRTGFALIGTVVLPYMVYHYDNPTKLCTTAADSIVEYCSELLSQQQQASEAESSRENPLEHLATVMRLYRARTFNRDCYQWTKCTVKYLNDACQTQSTQLLVVLCELLERGPLLMQQTVLQMMLCVFQHTDTHNDHAITLNADFLKSVSRHVQSCHWREATRILKLAVARSSSLSVPQQDADNNRQLAGRTMHFIIDMTRVLSVGYSSNSADASPKKHVSECTLRKPWVAQIRVREHLVNLLNASGLRVGLPKSPSVIFSQSSHDVGAEMPSSVYGSSADMTGGQERASTPTPDGNQTDYTSDSFPRVFKEFDFLEAEHDSMSESADSCFNWMATMRPSSFSAADEDGQSAEGDQPASVASDAGSRSRATDDRHTDSDTDSEEESVSEHGGDTPPSVCSADLDRLYVRPQSQQQPPQSPTSSLGHTQSLMASRVSLCGSVGTPSVEWGMSFPLFGLECAHHSTGQIDETWAMIANDVFTDQDGTATANAMLVFSQLYRECCMKVCGLLRDACHFLSLSARLKDMSAQLFDVLDLLTRSADIPYLFVTPSLLRLSGVLQRQKFNVLDVREHYETFIERKEHCIRTLNGVKSNLKLQLMGQKVEDSATADQSYKEVELCRTLQKLFFQLLLMCEGFVNITQLLTNKIDQQHTNLSSEVLLLQRELLCAVSELSSSGGEHVTSVDVGQSPMSTMVHLLQNRDVKQAITILRSCRSVVGRSELYGCCEEVDVDVLLLLYSKTQADTQPGGCFAVVGSESALLEGCMQLREANIQLKASLNNMASVTKTPRGSQPLIHSPH